MAGSSVPCRNSALAVCTETLSAPGNLASMRCLIMRNASDSGELSGAAVEMRISLWASTLGAASRLARAAAKAISVFLMAVSSLGG